MKEFLEELEVFLAYILVIMIAIAISTFLLRYLIWIFEFAFSF